jgi:hypothetical protein
MITAATMIIEDEMMEEKAKGLVMKMKKNNMQFTLERHRYQ